MNYRKLITHALQYKGFTLVELVTVIAVLAILGGAATSRLVSLGKNTRLTLLNSTKSAMMTAFF